MVLLPSQAFMFFLTLTQDTILAQSGQNGILSLAQEVLDGL